MISLMEEKYIGGRKLTFYRDLNEIPVLAKAGAIIPLSKTEANSVENPVDLEIKSICRS